VHIEGGGGFYTEVKCLAFVLQVMVWTPSLVSVHCVQQLHVCAVISVCEIVTLNVVHAC